MADNASMNLRILTPAGIAGEAACDSALLTLRDGADGRGGGKAGVQRDHAPAVMALAEGEIRASREGKPVLRAKVSGGFASVKDNVITIITDSAELLPAE